MQTVGIWDGRYGEMRSGDDAREEPTAMAMGRSDLISYKPGETGEMVGAALRDAAVSQCSSKSARHPFTQTTRGQPPRTS